MGSGDNLLVFYHGSKAHATGLSVSDNSLTIDQSVRKAQATFVCCQTKYWLLCAGMEQMLVYMQTKGHTLYQIFQLFVRMDLKDEYTTDITKPVG